ncbi:MAG TPA: hypothetical protein VFW53_00150 [Gallionella sp.]|nr:hypothetical protein [Gallionella sp.]
MHPLWLNRLLLIFALLFAQTGGLTHGISHVLEEQRQSADQSLPHHAHCDLCEAYAQLGSAIGSADINVAASKNCEAPHLASFSSRPSHTFAAFAARAPPYAI